MFAVSQFTTMPRSAEEDLVAYQKAGVELIELCESKFPDNRRERLDLVARYRSASFGVCSVQTKVHSIFPDRLAPEPREPQKRLEAFKRAVGFWTEAMETPDLPFVLIAGVAPGQNLREGWRVARQWIKEAAKLASTCGARIAFEPLGPCMMYFDTFIYGLDQGLSLVEAAESDSVGLVVDAWHVWEERDVAARLQEIANRVFVAHACDWPKEGPRGLDDRVLPGDGIIPLRETICGPLRAGGYRGPFAIETLSDESLEGSLWAMDPEDLLRKAKTAAASLEFA